MKVRFEYRGEGLYIASEKQWGDAYGDYYPAADYEALEAKLAALVEVLNWIESWFIENKDGKHHCPWCYLSNQDKDGNDCKWNNIKHHQDCLIGAALAAKVKS